MILCYTISVIFIIITLTVSITSNAVFAKRNCDAVSTTSSTDEKQFAGYMDGPLVGRCCKKGFLRTPQCWVNSCGTRKQCSNTKPYCICLEGYTGEDCCTIDGPTPPPSPTVVTTASTTAAAPTTTTTAAESTTTSSATTTTSTTTTLEPTTTTTTTNTTTTSSSSSTTATEPNTTTTNITATTPVESNTTTTSSNTTISPGNTTTNSTSTTAIITNSTMPVDNNTTSMSSSTMNTSANVSSSTTTETTTTMPTSTNTTTNITSTAEPVTTTNTSTTTTTEMMTTANTSTSTVLMTSTVASTSSTTTTLLPSTTTETSSSSSSSSTTTAVPMMMTTISTSSPSPVPQGSLDCQLEISSCGKNNEIFPGGGYNGRNGEPVEDVAVDSSTTAVVATTTTTTTTTTTSSSPASTSAPSPTITVAPTTTLAPTSAIKMPEIVYFAPDDQRQINSYIAQSREQFFATLPLRYGFEGNQAAVYLANYAQLVADKITGAMWIATDYTVRLATAKIPEEKFAPSADFESAVAALPSSYAGNNQAYIDFVNRFGTHYVKEVTLGARASHIVEKSYCDVERQVALDEEVKRISDLAIGNGTDLSSLDKVVGGPSRDQLIANGLPWWGDQVTLTNAVRIELDLHPIWDLIDDATKKTSMDEAVADLMPTKDDPYVPPILECLFDKLTKAQIAAIVVGVIIFLGLCAVGIWYVLKFVCDTAGKVVDGAVDGAVELTYTSASGGTGQRGVLHVPGTV